MVASPITNAYYEMRECEYTLCIYFKCTYIVRNKGIKK
jgi:hypothetical protein